MERALPSRQRLGPTERRPCPANKMTWTPSTLPHLVRPRRAASPAAIPPILEPAPGRVTTLALLLADGGVTFGALHLCRILGLPVPEVDVFGVLAVITALSVLWLFGLQAPRRAAQGALQVSRLTKAWGILFALGCIAAILPFAGDLRGLPVVALVAWAGTGIVRLGVIRPVLRLRYGTALRGARVIVGTGELARRMASASDGRPWEPVLVGFVDDLEHVEMGGPGRLRELPAPYLGDPDLVRRYARERRISHVLVAREDLSRGRLVELARQWMAEDLQVSLVSTAFEVMVARASASLLGGLPLANLQPSPQRGWRLGGKRAVDIALSLAGGLVLLPILAAIAIAIKFTSPGPILYKQKRVGCRGKEFTLFKFRSMVANSDDNAHRRFVEAMIRGEAAGVTDRGEKVYKLINDPRITRLGRFIRATSLDEFPQLWNVIRGDMSLVGPRPCLPYEWDLYEEWQRSRLDVLPGITGLWQVSGRSRVPFEEMVLLDLHYIANWSLGLDFKLLLRTIPVVLHGSGGH
jgi:exopolysaccharide biosynthesis polyprenyl glycosylphosphotransferase